MRGLCSIVGVLLQDDKALHDGSDGQVLICCKLSPFAAREQHRSGVRLEAGYGLGLARLPDHVDGLTDAHADRERAELLVESHQHTRLHGCRQ